MGPVCGLIFLCVSLVAAGNDLVAVIGDGNEGGTRVKLLWESREPLWLEWSGGGGGGGKKMLKANWGSPQTVVLDTKEGKEYTGTLESVGDAVVVPFRFTTRASNIMFLSCNRYVEDGDASMFANLTDARRDLAVHLGDQVYLDDIVKTMQSDDSFQVLVDRIRNLYRKQWMEPTFQKFLLSSRHLMIADDHDFINNIDFSIFSRREIYSTFVQAAFHCYQQYQLALRDDALYAPPPPVVEDMWVAQLRQPSWMFSFLTPTVALALLDTRMERTFGNYSSTSAPILGSRQMREFKAFLQRVRRANVQHLFVASSVPFMVVDETLASIIEWVEREKYPLYYGNVEVGDILEALFAVRREGVQVYVVGGDLHHASEGWLTSHALETTGPKSKRKKKKRKRKQSQSPGEIQTIHSFVTSGITSGSTAARSNHIAAMCWYSRLRPPHLDGNGLIPIEQYESQVERMWLGKNFLVFDVAEKIATWKWTWEPELEDGDLFPYLRQLVVDHSLLSVVVLALVVIFWVGFVQASFRELRKNFSVMFSKPIPYRWPRD